MDKKTLIRITIVWALSLALLLPADAQRKRAPVPPKSPQYLQYEILDGVTLYTDVLAPLLQAGVEFQQDIPLRARGENADPPDRQHLHRGRTRQAQERKIREQGAEGVVQCFRAADAQHDRHAGTASDETHRQGGRQVILLYHKGLQEGN